MHRVRSSGGEALAQSDAAPKGPGHAGLRPHADLELQRSRGRRQVEDNDDVAVALAGGTKDRSISCESERGSGRREHQGK